MIRVNLSWGGTELIDADEADMSKDNVYIFRKNGKMVAFKQDSEVVDFHYEKEKE